MRFDVYKRALMLTAATVALLSGPAYADHVISKNETDKLQTGGTSGVGNIVIQANGSLSIPSSSTASAAPAIEINSNNTVIMDAGSILSFSDTGAATGIQMDQGFTGEAAVAGTINLTGSGTGKTGILIGNPNSTSILPFTGKLDAANNTAYPGDLTAAIIAAGGVLNVTGDGSDGIRLSSLASVTGDIVVNGVLSMQPANLTATTATGGAVTAVEIDGTMTGNLLVGQTGVISSVGAGAQGVIVLGSIDGRVENLGVVTATGSASPVANGTNPIAGSAFVIANNVTGGIYNGGPHVTGDTDNRAATIQSTGNSPTLAIEPGFGGLTAAAITIGGRVDPGGLGTFSLINRGAITSATLNANDIATAVVIGSSGATAASPTTLTNGILNTGTISASATGNTTAKQPTVSTAISVGQFATITGGITNSNQTNGGTISALVSGSSSGIASAIVIAPNANVTSVTNSGTIVASATVTDSTVTSETAFAIIDQSGTLLTVNNNGTITARAAAIVNGTFAPLDNNGQLARSIDLSAANGAVNINNTGNGTIVGDIHLGAFGDTITTSGNTGTITSSITGNINFDNGANTLTVGSNSQVVGDLLLGNAGTLNITVASSGKLNATNNGLTSSGRPIPSGTARNITVTNLNVATGGELDLTLSNAYNLNVAGNAGPIIAATSSGVINFDPKSTLAINFGGFVTATNRTGTAQFVVFDASHNNITIANASQVQSALESGVPFLFSGNVCAYDVTGFSSCGPAAGNPIDPTHSDVVLNLTPKTATDLKLKGFAATMFDPVNAALAGDNLLGAAVIQAGVGIDPVTQKAKGNALYQSIYSNFAPDVTGSARAIAISITDQSSGIVGERQRKLRMYAGQDSDATLWAQEYGQRLNVPNKVTAGGYTNTGFGMAVGMDSGSISSGRYGAALTFYAGNTHEKEPRLSKTASEWYMLTGYSDWRGKGLFFDSQISVAYGNLRGKRTISIDDVAGTNIITRTADGKRSSEMAAGGFSTGFIMNWGGTVFMPQFSMDGLTLREEGYTESGGGPGMDLHIQPYYANSLRAFLGADLRQDLKMGDFYLQPEARAGFRYDALDGATKLHVNFAGDQSVTPVVDAGNPFTIKGPDPARGNLVLGGGLSVTTDAWSIGLNYDYARGVGGTKGTTQDAMITLVGRI
jgi:hypothetical protein